MFALELTADPRGTVEALRDVVRAELTSDLIPAGEGADPSVETGELGFTDQYDRAHLTITVGFSAAGYEKLGVISDKPADLIEIPWGLLGDQPENPSSGDVIVQVCADSAFITEHVLRHIEHALAGKVSVLWAHTGVQRYSSRAGRTSRSEGRAWIGFLDGTSNLDPGKNDEDKALTFVNPAPEVLAAYPKNPSSQQPGPYGGTNIPIFPPDLREHPGHEPAWTRGGSYLVVRVSLNDLANWDETDVPEQEQVVGRTKPTGVALDLADQPGADSSTPPAFAANPTDERVNVAAHIRKANPRTAEDQARRIFRRGYPLYEGSSSGLRRGLIFACYARTLSTQFEFITRAWLTNPNFPRSNAGVDQLRAFDQQVLSGGYYFVPALDHPNQPWSWHIPSPA